MSSVKKHDELPDAVRIAVEFVAQRLHVAEQRATSGFVAVRIMYEGGFVRDAEYDFEVVAGAVRAAPTVQHSELPATEPLPHVVRGFLVSEHLDRVERREWGTVHVEITVQDGKPVGVACRFKQTYKARR